MEEIIQEALSKGVEMHVAGEFDLAGQLYVSVLKLQPNHADANHNMGLLKRDTGNDLESLPYLQAALRADTSVAQFWLSYIKALINLERLDEAGRILDLAKESGIESEEFVELNQLINTATEGAPVSEPEIETPSLSVPNILDSLKLNQALRLAEKAAKEGNTEEAKRIYKDILAKFPKNKRAQQGLVILNETEQSTANQTPPEDAINRLIKLYHQGQLLAAIDLGQALTQQYPDAFMVWNVLGAAQKGLGRVFEASQAFQRVAELNPNNADGFSNLGVTLKDQGKLDEAIEAFNKALSIEPNNAEAYNNMGNALKGQDKLDEAIEAFNKALSLKPDYAEAHNNMGNALKDQDKLDEAIAAYNKALSLKPNYAEAHNNMGITLQDQGKLDEAIAAYNKALSLKPDYAEAHNNMGITLQDQGKLDEAIEAYNKALSLKPDYPEAYYNIGNALKGQDKPNEAIEALKKALSIKPDYAEAYNKLGIALGEQGKLEEALEVYNKALTIKPDYAAIYNNMGVILQEQGKPNEAIDAFSKALSINPDHAAARAQKLHQQARICDWDKVKDDLSFLADLGIHGDEVPPFSLLALEDDPYRHRLRSENYVKKKFLQNAVTDFVVPNQKPKRLRIGYFSADFKEHPVAQLIAKVIETHDRECFEIYGYSIGPVTNDKMRQRLMSGFDVFHDVKDMNAHDIGMLARRDKIDIAVDLTGYTQNSRPAIFAFRAAPIQVNYLGYPGTMGSDLFDYIIADQNLIPNESQKYYAEKPIYLPHHYQAQDDKLHISDVIPPKSELGLPEDGFVFCAINNTYKITPSEFNIWMRLLQNMDGSVLWLLERNEWVKANLIKEAYKRGIPSERLVFAQRVPHDKYLAQFRQADLYLDTFNYNAGATASNALWAGLPVLTKLGKGYTARMAGSLIASIGLNELITHNETEYEKLALELAKNPKELASIKQKLAINRLSKPLFNTDSFTKHLENGYQRAYQRYFEGKKPAAIYVPE